MQRKSLEQDEISCSALISTGAESEVNVEKALQLLVEMQRKGSGAGCIHIRRSLINAGAKGGNAEKALQLLVDMQREGRALSSMPGQRAATEGITAVGGDTAEGPGAGCNHTQRSLQ